MSEIISVDGQAVTIGSCEDLWYIRWMDFQELYLMGRLAQRGGNDSPEGYLSGRYRFRFPYPDEDGIMYHKAYERRVSVRAPKSLIDKIFHRDKCTRCVDAVNIWAQRPSPNDDALMTVVECPECLCGTALDLAQATRLCESIALNYSDSAFHVRIARRILDGYHFGKRQRYMLVNRFGSMSDLSLFRKLVEEIIGRSKHLGNLLTGPAYYELDGLFFVSMSHTQFQYCGSDLLCIDVEHLVKSLERDPKIEQIEYLHGLCYLAHERKTLPGQIDRLRNLLARLTVLMVNPTTA